MSSTKPRPVGGDQSPNMAMCIFSIPGAGKTRFIGSGENVLIIRPPQDHTDSIRKPAERNIQEIVVRVWDDMNRVLTAAMNGDYDEFDWVWLDSISLLQDSTLDGLWEQVVAEKPQRARFGLDVQEYGINIHRLGLWVRQMAGIGSFNFGVTAHTFWGKNIDDDDLLMPWVQGKNMPEKVCGCMNVVGYMEVRKLKLAGEDKATERRVINFNQTDRYYAKDQFDAFPKGRLVDPTMPAFMEAVKAARAKQAAPKATTRKTTTKRRAAGRKKA